MEQLFKNLLGADNTLRNNAEQMIAELEKNPEGFLTGLINVGRINLLFLLPGFTYVHLQFGAKPVLHFIASAPGLFRGRHVEKVVARIPIIYEDGTYQDVGCRTHCLYA